MKTINHSMMLDSDDRISVDVTDTTGLPPARLVVRSPNGLSWLTVYLSAKAVDHLLLTAVATQRELDDRRTTASC